MERVACSLCGADNAEVLFEGRDRMHSQSGRFPVNRCRSCGLIYLSPRPDRTEIGRYYPDNYAPYSPAIDDELSSWHRWNRRYSLAKRLRVILSHTARPGRALDVGCATGNLLDALRRRGWEVHGVELNARAAAYARERLGLSVFTGELADARYPDGWFDLIIFWDVLEHMHDPKGALQEAARVARSGGRLVLSLPNLHSIEAQLFGPYWAGWDVPRHLHMFTRPVLDRLLTETGWRISKMLNLTGRHWLFTLSLRFWLEEQLQAGMLRYVLLKVVGSPPVHLLMLPYYTVVERLNLGSVMTVLAYRWKG